jgi:amino acid adenylation domain-containing protein
MERVFAADRVVLYGPTEATILCAGSRVPPGGAMDRALVGRPLPGMTLRLAGAAGRPVPPGVSGEIWIGGPGVARGYHGREDLTRKKFVRLGEERFYRSGDLARHLPDGTLEFLGRIDDQVKIRGHRVEPGEVESALAAHPGVAAAVVLARPGSGGEARLVAWVVPAPGATPETLGTAELRDFLRRSLPEILLPSACVVLDALPLLSTGKVDRRALPEPDEALRTLAEAPPRTLVEQVLAGIWSEVLGVGQVGVRDDFFVLGGHSLLAVRVTSRVRALLGVDLPLRELFEHATVADLAGRIEALRAGGAAPGQPALAPVPRDAELPLSFAQERLWFLDQIRPGSAVYNVAGAWVVEGELHPGALAAALSEVVRRHEALRTVFVAVAGTPVQAVVPARPVELPLVDLGALPEPVRATLARELARQEARRPFDLGRGPLLRAALLRLGHREHVALVSLHHIVTDGWSMRVFAGELAVVYRDGLAGRAEPLPPLPIQYADYAVWQRRQLAGEAMAAGLAFWRQRLAGAEPVELAADRSRPAERTPRGDVVDFALSPRLSIDVRALGRRQGATPFMVLLAAFQALLARSTGRDDVSVGTPVAGRSRLETEGLIGFFVNLLVLRSSLAGDPEAAELLRRVREDALESLAHQDVPFDRLVQELRPGRTLSHTPLFQVLFVLQNAPPALPDLPGLRLRPVWAGTATAKFDLTLALEESADGFRGRLEYAGDLFDRATAVRLLGHFESLQAGMAAEPGRRLGDLPLLSAAERHQLEREWADTATGRRPVCIHTLVEEQAVRTPEAVGVVFGDGHLTYGELDRRANRLAHRLRGLGVGPEVRVGVHLDRSAEMVISLLAVLKAGGAYVPIDPTYPAERVTFMAGDSRARVLLTRSGLPEVAAGAETAVVRLDGGAAWAGLPASSPGAAVRPDHLAYVIYTSGSTGRPKGAMNSHRGVVNRLLWMVEEHGLTAAERFLQKTPYSFDVSVWELFCPLIVGARLVVAVPGGHHDPVYLARRIAEEGITTLHFAPSMLQAFLEVWSPASSPALRRVVCSGEALPFELQQSFLAAAGPRGPALHNLYGPTEAAIEVTAWACVPDERLRTVPIGRPIVNARIHLLDRSLRPVAIGVPGELFIGGRPVARGYLDRPDLTAERFVPDPFAAAGEEGARLYRTGDLARHLSSGAVEFLGRLDHQVKVRGLRIELGEIETALAQHPGVREAVVVARRPGPGSEPRLTAYFVPRRGPSPARVEPGELREHLKRKLPDYMVPAVFLSLDGFPLGPSGKVDRRALPEPGAGRPGLEAVYVPPTTLAEARLAAIWREVLGLERIGVHDNFFELGGDSILSIRIVARAQQEHVFLTPRHLFQYQTIAELVAVALQPESRDERDGSAGVLRAMDKDEPLLPGLGESDLGGAFDEIEFEGRPD